MPVSYKALWVILPLALFLFSWNMGTYDLWPADEPRFAEVAREMSLTGDYLAPHVNGQPYNEKPPLLFWAIAGTAQLWGEVDGWSARLPSVLSALLVLVLTYALAGRMGGTTAAIWSSLILISTARFWWQARTVQIDMLLCACMILALYALWRWDEERNRRWLILLYLAMAAGMLAKGPPALVFPLLFILAYYSNNPQGRRATYWLWGTLGAIAITAAWYIPARMAVADSADEALQSGMGANLFRNTIGRMFMGVSKAQPPWYYLSTLPVDLLPWTFLAPWALAWFWKVRKQSKAHWFLWCWTIPALLFFSISIGKRAIYILPLFPAIAIIFGLYISQCNYLVTARARRFMLIAWAILLLPIILLPFIIPYTEYQHALQNLDRIVIGSVGLLLLSTILNNLRHTWESPMLPVRLITRQMCILLFLITTFILPAINPYKSARAFCEPLHTLQAQEVDYRLYSLGFSREEYIFYSNRFHEPRFTGLIGLEDAPLDTDLYAMAQLQKDARKAITHAVKDLPLSSVHDYTDAERKQLLEHIETALLEDPAYDSEELQQFESALRQEIDAFNITFHQEHPAFLMVQEEDWRWLQALHSNPGPYHLIHAMPVGSRYAILLANTAGAALPPIAPYCGVP